MNKTYAIVSDITPNRCNVDIIGTTGGDLIDVSNELDVDYRRIMWVSDGVELEVGDRPWHKDGTITGN